MRREVWCRGKEASMTEILDAREKRSQIQQELLAKGGETLVSFTLNIPGPVKTFPLAEWSFFVGESLIEHVLEAQKTELLEKRESREHTGYQAFYRVQGSPYVVKRALCLEEESHPLGRLFDFDVLDKKGRKISRQELGFPERLCLLCGRPAFFCGRSRRHSAAELMEKVTAVMGNFYQEQKAAQLGRLMEKALLWEVETTLKPGLVDRVHRGAHKDMERKHFVASARALVPYFTCCAREGLDFSQKPEDLEQLFPKLRNLGQEAEKTMLQATGGVNTHKGMIFSGGIFCAVAGYEAGYWGDKIFSRNILEESRPAEQIFERQNAEPVSHKNHEIIGIEKARVYGRLCRHMMKHILEDYECRKKGGKKEEEKRPSNGEMLYEKYGIRGVRGEAFLGFPHVLEEGLPYFENLLDKGFSLNDAGLLVLLYYIANTEDTNIISRSDYETAEKIKRVLKKFLDRKDYRKQLEILPALDAYFVKHNISPGGSADMLALTYFLHLL